MVAKTTVLSLILCAVFTSNLSPVADSFQISISVDSNTHQVQIKSYLSRELRQSGDVEIGDNDTEYELAVVHIFGAELLHAYSFVVRQCLNPEYLMDKEFLRKMYAGIGFVESHGLIVSGGTIKDACERIIAQIDVEVFEEARQSKRRIKPIVDNLLQQSNK